MWITIDEASSLLNITRATIYNRIEKGQLNRKDGAKQSNGKSETLIELESLPASAQVVYYKRLKSSGNDSDVRIDQDDVQQMSDDEMKTAWHRMQVIIEMDQRPVGVNRTDHLRNLCKRENISLSKLYKWQKLYRENGLTALVKRKERADSGESRSFDEDAVKFLKNQYVHYRNKLRAYQELESAAVDMEWQIGSYSQACRILKSGVDNNEAMRAYMNGGQLALKNIAGPCILRDYSDLSPLEYICGDHMQCDVLVWDEAQKKIIRPWLTAWMDMRTRALWGWHISRQPNSRTIALALRHGILPKSDNNPVFGIPQNAYIDNGRDYKSFYISGLRWQMKKLGKMEYDLETKSVFGQLQIMDRYALPFNPGSKPIERAFRTFHEQFEAFLPGYVSGKTDTRDGAKVQMEIDQRKLLFFDDYKLQFRYYIEGVYHQNSHRGEGMDGKSPVQVWNEYLENGFEPMTLRPNTLDLLLLMRKEGVKVQRHGVTLNGRLYSNPGLIHYLKKIVDLRWDPDDLENVYVFYKGKYLLTAFAFIYGSMRDDQAVISARMAENRRTMKAVKHQFLALSNGVDKPDNTKNKTSIKIKDTAYDKAAAEMDNDRTPEIVKPKGWKILPPDEMN